MCPSSVTWNGTTYYYSVNGQGDVIGIADMGTAVKEQSGYDSNAWLWELGSTIKTTIEDCAHGVIGRIANICNMLR